MTKLQQLGILAATLILVGCVAGGPSQQPVKEVGKVEDDGMSFPPPPEETKFRYERMLRGSTDVVPDEENGSLMRALTGTYRKGEGLGKPYGVAVHEGRVFVGDTGRREVNVFDLPEQKYFTIGGEDPGALSRPMGLDVDKVGNLYVLDSLLKLINVYNRDGVFLRTIGVGATDADKINRPAGLAVNPEGTRLYAVDIGGTSSDDHKILVYDAKSGAFIKRIGKRGSGPGEFNLPRDVVVAADGSIYVVDGGNFRVQHLTEDGVFISQFGSIGRLGGQFSRPKELALDKEGNIYVVDTAFGNFQIFNPKGELLLAVGSRSEQNAPAKYMLPAGIAVDTDGRVYMVDQFFQKVEVFRPFGLDEKAGFSLGSKAALKQGAESKAAAPTPAPTK